MIGWLTVSTSMAATRTRLAQNAAARHMEHLSAGSRILRAGDDPAGSAVAVRLSTRQRSAHQAQRNIQDGLSVLAVADGGLAGVGDLLVRLRELAVQSASGNVSDGQRAAIQEEVDEILSEVDRIAKTARWQDRALIAEVHADVGFVIDNSGSMGGEIAALYAAMDGFRTQVQDAGVDVAFGLGTAGRDRGDGFIRVLDIGGPNFDAALAGLGMGGGAQDPYAALLEASGATETPGLYPEPDAFSWRGGASRYIVHATDTSREIDYVPDGIADDEISVGNAVAGERVEIHNISPAWRSQTYDELVAATGGGLYDIGDAAGSGIAAAMAQIAERISELGEEAAQSEDIELHVGADPSSRLTVLSGIDATSVGLGISDVDLSTQGGARDALAALDQAVRQVAACRAQVGAETSRLQSAYEVQAGTERSTAASHAQIHDADVATTTAALFRQQVLANSGASVVARMHDFNLSVVQMLIG